MDEAEIIIKRRRTETEWGQNKRRGLQGGGITNACNKDVPISTTYDKCMSCTHDPNQQPVEEVER